MVRQSRSRPLILQAERPPQSIANPGDHDGKDEDPRLRDGGAGTGPLAAGLGGRCRLRPGGDPAVSWNCCGAPDVSRTEFRVLRAGLDRQGEIRRAEDVGLHQGGSTLAGW